LTNFIRLNNYRNSSMLANYGYKDGSGEFFITIDTDKCNACGQPAGSPANRGQCVEACPQKVLEMITDEADPFREIPVAAVTEAHRRKIKYSCAGCKPACAVGTADRPASNRPPLPLSAGLPAGLPCIAACQPGAIKHSW
jgi:ferredoxin